MKQTAASLTEGPIARTLVRLCIPIVLGNLLQAAYQITDTFWVGRLSTQAVAAVSLSFPINVLLIAIGGGLPIAGSVLIAQYKGRGQIAAMNHVAAQTLNMVVLTALLLSTAGMLLSEAIMRTMGAAPDVLGDAVLFLRISLLGYIFVFGFFVYQSFMRGLGEVRVPVYIVLVTVLLNFILDPLFIFGYGPIPAMGAAGAAISTVCTQALATAIGFGLLLQGSQGIHLKLADFRPDLAVMRRSFYLGLPASMEQSTRALGMTVITALVSSFGTVAVAAYGIGLRVFTFVMIPALGLSIATTTLVGQNIGAGLIDRAERTHRIAMMLALSVLTVAGACVALAAPLIVAFFLPHGGAAAREGVLFVRIVALTFGCIGVQQVVAGTFRGSGNTVSAMLLAMVSLWMLQFPLAYALSRHTPLGMRGIWWSTAIGNVLVASIAIAWSSTGTWKRKQLLPESGLQRKVGQEAQIDESIA